MIWYNTSTLIVHTYPNPHYRCLFRHIHNYTLHSYIFFLLHLGNRYLPYILYFIKCKCFIELLIHKDILHSCKIPDILYHLKYYCISLYGGLTILFCTIFWINSWFLSCIRPHWRYRCWFWRTFRFWRFWTFHPYWRIVFQSIDMTTCILSIWIGGFATAGK